MRTYSQSQTKISLTSSEFSECSRCEFGERHLWAVNSWKKYLNPVHVAILCPVFPHQPICGFTCLQKFHFAFLSWGLETQPLGHLPVLNRLEGNDSLREPWGLCPCHECVLDWESHGLKKKICFTHISAGLSKDDKQFPESDRFSLIFHLPTESLFKNWFTF